MFIVAPRTTHATSNKHNFYSTLFNQLHRKYQPLRCRQCSDLRHRHDGRHSLLGSDCHPHHLPRNHCYWLWTPNVKSQAFQAQEADAAAKQLLEGKRIFGNIVFLCYRFNFACADESGSGRDTVSSGVAIRLPSPCDSTDHPHPSCHHSFRQHA